MKCTQCGRELLEGQRFCIGCGTPVPESNTQQPFRPLPPVRRKKKKKRGLWFLIPAVAVALVVCFVLIGNLQEKNTAYNAAMALYESGDYVAAEESFRELGNFKGAAEMAENCEKQQQYAEACQYLLTSGMMNDYAEKALRIFESLGDFENAAEKAAEAADRVSYLSACHLMEESEDAYAEAQEMFLSLGDYEDAVQRAALCQDYIDCDLARDAIRNDDMEQAMALLESPAANGLNEASILLGQCNDYQTAKAAIEAGSAAEAAALLEGLPDEFPNVDTMLTECRYQAANEAYQAGKYYEAYAAYTALGSYGDAEAKASACVQAFPANGELYRAGGMSKSVKFTVQNTASVPSVIKMYRLDNTGAETLVTTFFIQAGTDCTVYIPAGTYKMKEANGSQWFGVNDLFGDEGTYYEISVSGSDTFEFENGYEYTMGQGVGGDAVSDHQTDRGSF